MGRGAAGPVHGSRPQRGLPSKHPETHSNSAPKTPIYIPSRVKLGRAVEAKRVEKSKGL